jgi:hypothetical protein
MYRKTNGGEMPEPDRPCSLLASEVEVRPVKWLWPGYLPLGKTAILEGDPDLGKTLILLDAAARVTAGLPMPDGSLGIEGGAAVVFLGFEDDAADTVVPRFLAAGGDPKKFTLLTHVMGPEGPRPYSIPDEVALIEAVVKEKCAILLLVDPLVAALGDEVKTQSDHAIRRALVPLRDLAERCCCTVWLNRHWNKNVALSNLLYRGGGSIGITAAARAAHAVAPDPEDPTRRVLIPIKANLAAPEARPALRYRTLEVEVPGTEIRTAGIEWLGKTDAQQLRIALAQAGAPIDSSAVGEAVGILHELLANGAVLADEAKQYMKEAGVTGRTLDRAKKRLGVRARPRLEDDGKKHWWWSLATAKHAGTGASEDADLGDIF